MLVEVRLFANVDCGCECFVVIKDPAVRGKKRRKWYFENKMHLEWFDFSILAQKKKKKKESVTTIKIHKSGFPFYK